METTPELPLAELAAMALFAQVVEARSFSTVATRAGLGRSAVSKRIAQLEERLGVRLLQRSTRKLAVTPDGLRFYEHCAALVGAARAAAAAVSSASNTARGRLRVNAPVTLAQMHLAAPLASFLERHPDIEVEVSTENRVVDPVEGGFDVIIRVTRLEAGSFVARRLAEDRLVVCAAPAYLERRGEPRRPDELVQHNCLHYSLVPRAGEWRFHRAATAGRGRARTDSGTGTRGDVFAVPARGNFATSDGSLLREMALAGVGLAVLPSFMVARELGDGRLRAVLTAYRRGRVGIYALLATRRQLPLRTRLFVDHLARHFAATPIGAAAGAR